MIIKNFLMEYCEHKNLSCEAPCSMYRVLLGHGLIDDPFYGCNEESALKLSDNDCIFTSMFNVNEADIEKKYNEMVFHGLDTICEIYINSKFVSKTMNMHRTYSFDVKSFLKSGENELKLIFRSPTKYFQEMNRRHYVPGTPDGLKGVTHLRKALYMSGWDWGPKLPDMGIFRNIELLSYNEDKIEDFLVKQYHNTDSVLLRISIETTHKSDVLAFAEIDGKRAMFENGECSIEIDNPKLWWIRGYGEQFLYDLKLTLEKDGNIIDEVSKKIGLRTLEVSRENDKYGKEFTFVINGVKIFSMGANYIPDDSLLSRVTYEKTKKMLNSAAFANFNTIRIWGGGVYPDEYFYDLCDEYGFLVWQDIMVACGPIWLNENMKAEFIEEVSCNVKRIRNHASLGIICGNNEVEEEMALNIWGANMRYQTDYITLYENLIPELVYEYAPQTFYWPSSPSSGGDLAPIGDESNGDSHYWKVWHGEKPFTEYRNHMFRFCSEFGFQSFPSIKTIKTFCDEKEFNPFSKSMENHQKNKAGNKKILTYLADTYRYPYNFENLIYASQLLQAEAIKFGVEHFRRIRECCKGAIYWQFNDCWPVASWSSVDYFGRYKALHYYAKKFFSPVLCALFIENGKMTVSVMNETRKSFRGKIKFGIRRNNLDTIYEECIVADVPSLASQDIVTIDLNTDNVYNTFAFAELYDENDTLLIRQTELLSKPKHFDFLEPKITVNASHTENGVALEFNANVYAKNVFVDFKDEEIGLSDNYFDLTGVPYKIFCDCTDIDKVISGIVIKSTYDI